jgi:hypothetical protein
MSYALAREDNRY